MAGNDKMVAVSESFSFYPEDLEVIRGVAERYGFSKSQALRWIIRDWVKRNQQREAFLMPVGGQQ